MTGALHRAYGRRAYALYRRHHVERGDGHDLQGGGA